MKCEMMVGGWRNPGEVTEQPSVTAVRFEVMKALGCDRSEELTHRGGGITARKIGSKSNWKLE